MGSAANLAVLLKYLVYLRCLVHTIPVREQSSVIGWMDLSLGVVSE